MTPSPIPEDRKSSGGKLTKAQRDLIVAIGFVPNALMNGDEYTPKWWLEGRPGAVKANVAESLIRRGWVRLSGKWGGQPGILGFTITEAGRAALSKASPPNRS
jgi:hypothetical protein